MQLTHFVLPKALKLIGLHGAAQVAAFKAALEDQCAVIGSWKATVVALELATGQRTCTYTHAHARLSYGRVVRRDEAQCRRRDMARPQQILPRQLRPCTSAPLVAKAGATLSYMHDLPCPACIRGPGGETAGTKELGSMWFGSPTLS